MKGQMAGNLVIDGHKATKEEKSIANQLQELSSQLSLHLQACKASDIADLLECYDMAYRIGYQKLPDADMVLRHKNRLVEAWRIKKGCVEESSVFGMIAGDVKYSANTPNNEFVLVYNTILKNWIGPLLKHNTFPGVSAYEKFQRLAMIMRENLDFIDRPNKLKKQWYEFNNVDDLSTLGSTVLRSYRRFISSIPPTIVPFKENMKLGNQILQELVSRKDLDPYDKEAFRMALKFHTELMQA